jgi:hypothetical protein
MVAFWPFVNIKLNVLTRFKRSVTLHLNGGVVRKDVIATANRTNKAEALGVVEPFNSTRLHAFTSLARHFDK